MRQDVTQKDYLKDAVRIADLLNGCFFQGRQVIHPQDVKEDDGQLVSSKRQQAWKLREQDVVYKIIHGANCIIFGIEDQSYVDPSMPLRALEYMTGQYSRQRKKIVKEHKREKDLRGDEFVSAFSLKDRLHPVLIIVLYFGDQEWQGPLTLHELLDWRDIPEEWKGLFADYKMILLEARKIQNLENFQSDLKILFGFLQNQDSKEKLQDFFDKNQEELSDIPEDLLLVIDELSKTNQLRNMLEENRISNEGGGTNMCKGLEEMIKDAQDKVREEYEKKLEELQRELDKLQRELDNRISNEGRTTMCKGLEEMIKDAQDKVREEYEKKIKDARDKMREEYEKKIKDAQDKVREEYKEELKKLQKKMEINQK